MHNAYLIVYECFLQRSWSRLVKLGTWQIVKFFHSFQLVSNRFCEDYKRSYFSEVQYFELQVLQFYTDTNTMYELCMSYVWNANCKCIHFLHDAGNYFSGKVAPPIIFPFLAITPQNTVYHLTFSSSCVWNVLPNERREQ